MHIFCIIYFCTSKQELFFSHDLVYLPRKLASVVVSLTLGSTIKFRTTSIKKIKLLTIILNAMVFHFKKQK